MTATAYVDTFANDNLPARKAWPELLMELPTLQYPPRLNCVAALLDHWISIGQGDRPAIYHAQGVWSYSQLQAHVNRIAQVLRQEMQLVPGNRVLLHGPNSPLLAACWLAIVKAGCIAVPTMPLLRANELAAIVTKAHVGAAICAAELKEDMTLLQTMATPLRQVIYFNDSQEAGLEQRMATKLPVFEAVTTHAEDVCMIGFTSGTTGVPKGTMHFHRDMLAICDCFPRSILKSQPDDIFIGTPSLAFTFGLGGLLLFPLRVGAATVLLEKPTPNVVLKAIQKFGATICFTAPTFYRQMTPLALQYDLRSLKKTVSAGEALPMATRQGWQQATGLDLIDGIGSTEMLHIFISAADAQIRPGATGKPIPGYRACILDANGNMLPPGKVGRLAVKGPTGCRYLADERQQEYVQHGWNVTGDAYMMDVDGYFWFQARLDDMIISAGYNIAGPEVEAVLLQHPAVAECAVVGWPDELRGHIVKAYVILNSGWLPTPALANALQIFVKERIAPYKYPRMVAFCTTLPRTESGKLQRHKLRHTNETPSNSLPTLIEESL